MKNQTMLKNFQRNIGKSDAIQGKTIWLDKGKESGTYELSNTHMKQLERACQEADRKERWLDVPVDVFVCRVGDVVSFEIRIRKEGV